MIGAARGYKVKLCLPANASHGAEAHSEGVRRGNHLHRSGGRVRRRDPKVPRSLQSEPERVFLPRPIQQSGQLAGALSTRPASRFCEQTEGRLTHFVASMGTSGTCMGVTRRLRQDAPHVKCYSAQPASGFHGLEGLKHMPTAIVPGIYDESLPDGNLWIETEDAYAMVRRLGARRRTAGGHLDRRERGGALQFAREAQRVASSLRSRATAPTNI